MELNDISTSCSSATPDGGRRESLLQEEPESFQLHSPVLSGFPNVFEESRDMLLSAILVYGLVDLRQLVRDKKLFGDLDSSSCNNNNNKNFVELPKDATDSCESMDTDAWKNAVAASTPPHPSSTPSSVTTSEQRVDRHLLRKLLTLPISAKDIIRLVARHRNQIESSYIGKDATSMYLSVLDEIQATSSSSSSRELELEFFPSSFDGDGRRRVALVDFQIVAVEDAHLENELVYAICVDTARRRITVLFRGCSTHKDWTVCANNILKEQVNPLLEFEASESAIIGEQRGQQQQQQPTTIAIHSGYCQYLFNAKSQASGVSKFAEIVSRLRALLRQYPGYQIYATGHSLGAALATVFSFKAAATQCLTVEEQPQPITCINFASPMVGNLDFETAFQTLEAKGQLRCLRVTNHFDIFTQLPDRGNWLYVMSCFWGFHLVLYIWWTLLFFLCCQTRVYRHVGMDLHMYKQRNYKYLWGLNKNEPPKLYSYKIKHSQGTTRSFAWRVAQDWKKHLKQAVQRIMMIPFVLEFNTNHTAKEHLHRLTELAGQLDGVYLQELYDTKRFPSSSTKAPSSPPPSMSAMEAIASNTCFVQDDTWGCDIFPVRS